jgi:hypothetical protein
VIGLKSSPPQFKCNPPIAITTFILAADGSDHLSLLEMLLGLTEALQMIVITASGDTRYDQKQR